MKLGLRAAVVAAAGGIVFAGLAGPAYAAPPESCTGVTGQQVAHPEYFCNGLTVPPVHRSASDDKVKTVAVCTIDFVIAARFGGKPGIGGTALSVEQCARNVFLHW